jgi:putative ABC transport system permease protein
MIYREAFMLGLVGSLLGSVVGVIGAEYLIYAMGAVYRTTLPPIEHSAFPFILAAICGLGVSLVAAALPARKASRLSPLEAMRDVLPEELEGSSRWFTYIGIALVAMSVGMMLASIFGWLKTIYAVLGGILLLIALVFLLPLVVRPLSKLVTLALQPILAVESRLARLQLLRHRTRTALTIGVVFVAIGAGVGLASSVMNYVENVRSWYRKTIVADFFVRASNPDMATGLLADLPDSIGPQIEKIPGIKSHDAMRMVKVKVGNENAVLFARDYSSPEAPDLDIVRGDAGQLRQQLKDGQVALGSVLAERLNLKAGGVIPLDTDKGPQEFPIAAIVNDYNAGGLTIYMEREVARQSLGIDGVDAYVIKADHAQLAGVRDELKKITEQHGLLLQTFTEIQELIDRMMSGIVAALWGMVVVILVVAALGVTNTLTINVLEQTRELGLLRIVAMTQSQVRKTVFTQAVIMALLALVPGVAAGAAVAYLINLSLLPLTGHVVRFDLDPTLLAGSLVIGFIIVSLAAWFPAGRAARLNLLEALRTL